MKSRADYLTMREACVLVRVQPNPSAQRRLRRRIEAKERATGREILARLAGPNRTNYRTTEAALREHCPELFSKTEVVFQAMRDLSERLTDRVDGLQTRVVQLERQVDRLRRRHTGGNICS